MENIESMEDGKEFDNARKKAFLKLYSMGKPQGSFRMKQGIELAAFERIDPEEEQRLIAE